MPAPISSDLRLRAVKAVREGVLHRSIPKRFTVSVSSVRRWCRLYSETGSVDDPLPSRQNEPWRRLPMIRRWLWKQPNLTTDQICKRLLKRGYLVSHSTVWRMMTEKKSHSTKRRKSWKATNAGRKRFYLTPQHLERIRRFFPRSRGKPRVSDWRVVSGIIHVLINGMPWREAPPEYGPCKTLHNRWKRWCDKGIFVSILLALASRVRKRRVLMLDSTRIKAHRLACSLGLLPDEQGRRIGRTAGGLNCKLHVVTDAAGRPILLFLTAGNKSDIRGAEALLDALPKGAKFLVADRAYDANSFRKALKGKGIKHCIPPRRNRTDEIEHDEELCKSRNVVERSIGRMKDWRRVATRYDRCPNVFLNACALAAAVKFRM